MCLDGTGNSPLRNDKNVCRIFLLSKDVVGNIAYYDPGVGTLPRPGRVRFLISKAGRVAGLVSGHGMIDDVAEAYRFICQNYRDGDRLYFFGFSRGAHAARLLASVVAQIGLLPAHHEHLIPYAINLAFADKPTDAKLFSRKLGLAKPEIEFLGLFDSVKSAVFAVDRGWSPIRISVPLSWYNDSVWHVAHAMAIDEKRALYPINRWADEYTRPGTTANGRTVTQVWFPGDHCDVGGSHTDHGLDLSAATLAWITRQARFRGLTLEKLSEAQTQLANDHTRLASCPCHDLGKGTWLIAEALPTFSANLDDEPRWRFPNRRRGRFIPASANMPALLHSSVRERLASGLDNDGRSYKPRFVQRLLDLERHSQRSLIKWVE